MFFLLLFLLPFVVNKDVQNVCNQPDLILADFLVYAIIRLSRISVDVFQPSVFFSNCRFGVYVCRLSCRLTCRATSGTSSRHQPRRQSSSIRVVRSRTPISRLSSSSNAFRSSTQSCSSFRAYFSRFWHSSRSGCRPRRPPRYYLVSPVDTSTTNYTSQSVT